MDSDGYDSALYGQLQYSVQRSNFQSNSLFLAQPHRKQEEKHLDKSCKNTKQTFQKAQQKIDSYLISMDSPRPKFKFIFRKVRKIEVNEHKLQKIYETKKGSRLQTVCLNKNLKTQTKRYLFSLARMKVIDHQSFYNLQRYSEKGASFQNTNKLFQNQKIRQKCFNFYSQSQFIENIFQSDVMSLHNKIIIVKYLSRIRSNAYGDQRKWKQFQIKDSL